ncbi:MAG: preprotein translocase subunit YajC [Alphaproteobacteria bacterium]|nr:preprotein translocase subunit YajC [Alphaproteobacteria bacterium]
MFISPAYAQGAGAAGGGDFLTAILPFVLIIAIFYFFLIRPQQKKQKEHREKLAAIRRGDTIVSGGGLVGKVTKVRENNDELEVEIAPGTRVVVLRNLVFDVTSKTAPATQEASKETGSKGRRGSRSKSEEAAGSEEESADA